MVAKKCSIALLVCAVALVLVWFSWSTRKADRCFGDVTVLERILREYGRDHRGNLPSGPHELIENDYCRINDDGEWIAIIDGTSGCVQRPSSFDIAWGVRVTDLDEAGRVRTTGRWIVRPSDDSPCSESLCKALSYRLSQYLREQYVIETNPGP